MADRGRLIRLVPFAARAVADDAHAAVELVALLLDRGVGAAGGALERAAPEKSSAYEYGSDDLESPDPPAHDRELTR